MKILGSKDGKLVAGVREQQCSGILAIKPVHTLSSECDAGGVGWGGVEYQAQRRPHFHPNGLRPVRPGGQWKGQLFPKPGTCRFK